MRLEKHKKLGSLIKRVIYNLTNEVTKCDTKPKQLRLMRQINLLDEIRSQLDDELQKDFKELDNEEFFEVYYRCKLAKRAQERAVKARAEELLSNS